MTEFTTVKASSCELRHAAYHEAGHKILYERFGGAGDAVVWRNETGDPAEREWLGYFQPRVCPEYMRNFAVQCGTPVREFPANWRVLVGMAGLVAEETLNWGFDDIQSIADGLLFRINSGEASASDLKLMKIADIEHCELSYNDVDETRLFLHESWEAVQLEAEDLIELAATEPIR